VFAVLRCVTPVDNVITKRQKLIQRLEQGCIYYIVKKLPPSRLQHWHTNCMKSKSRPDSYSYKEAEEL
jgi:hypothetical protein